MKHLGNVLYVTTPEAFLSLDGENVVIKKEESASTRLPFTIWKTSSASPGRERVPR